MISDENSSKDTIAASLKLQYRDALEKSTNIISTICNIYYATYFIDLENDCYIDLNTSDKIRNVIGNEGRIQDGLERMTAGLVVPEYQEAMRDFNDMSKWQERLWDKESISTEFVGVDHGWSRAIIIVSERDVKQQAKTLIYLSLKIDNEKEIERRNQELEREIRLNEELRKIAEERHQKAILEERLRAADRINEAKTDFLHSMSHDIRTPVNAIMGFTNLAKVYSDDNPLVSKYLDKITSAGEHLLELIDEILEVDRIDSGRYEIEKDSVNLKEMVGELVEIIQPDMEKAELSFELDTTKLVNPYVICDKIKINKILQNLLGNSIKYTKPGGRVRLEVAQRGNNVAHTEKDVAQTENIYEFIVEDTGIGMTEEFIKVLFEPFERERTNDVSHIQGTGLGMAICQKLVTAMNGRIDVKSSKGVGTKISIFFELKPQLAQNPSQSAFNIDLHECTGNSEIAQTPSQSASVDISPSVSKRHVLVAEDNDENWEVLYELLKFYGVEAIRAEDGQKAVKLMEELPEDAIDIIFMDIDMPHMTGIEATKLIRNSSKQYVKNIPIYAMTADVFEESREACKKAGMDGYLPKPIDIKEVIKVLI